MRDAADPIGNVAAHGAGQHASLNSRKPPQPVSACHCSSEDEKDSCFFTLMSAPDDVNVSSQITEHVHEPQNSGTAVPRPDVSPVV